MKIKFGAIVTDGRGKLGGHVFSKNKAGAYIRTKVTPSNPQTARQSTVRSLFGAISQGWSALDATSRDGWNAAVPSWAKTNIFGDLKIPTGKALYQRLNNQAQVVGYPAIDTVPEKTTLPTDTLTGVAFDTTAGTITPAGVNATDDLQIVLFATGQLTAGTSFVKNRLRQIYNADADSYDAADAAAAYTDKFGLPDAGDNVYFGVKYVADNGQATPLQVVNGVIS